MSGYGSFRFALVALIPMSVGVFGCLDDDPPAGSGGEGGEGGEGGAEGGEGGEGATQTVGGGGQGGVGGLGGEGGSVDLCATLDCDDGNPCTADTCDAIDGCQSTDISAACDDGDLCNGAETCDPSLGCVSPTPVGYLEDFDGSAPGWTLGTLVGPLVDINSWSLVSMSASAEPTTFATQVFGNPNNGDLGEEFSYLQSPSIDLTGGGTVQFHTWSGNEDPGFDLERLDVSFNGGLDFQVLIDDLDPKWCSYQNWVPMDATVDAADGTTDTVFRFVYNTVDECCGSDGWFLDNFTVLPDGAVDCDDADPCTVDICMNNACQNPGEAACEVGPFFDCAGSGEG